MGLDPKEEEIFLRISAPKRLPNDQSVCLLPLQLTRQEIRRIILFEKLNQSKIAKILHCATPSQAKLFSGDAR